MELFTAGWASLLSCFYLFFSGIIVSYVAVARMVHCCLFFLSPSYFVSFWVQGFDAPACSSGDLDI